MAVFFSESHVKNTKYVDRRQTWVLNLEAYIITALNCWLH